MQRRARKEADKTARRRAILDAARTEFSRGSYGALTMTAVAGRAGLVKGTLYLYFETKEELLLELFEELLGEWLDEVERRLGDPRGAWDAERVADALSRSLEGREALTRLITVVGGVLEHNIGDDRARRFKRALHARVTRGGALLAQRLPRLGADGAVRLLFQVYALLTGFGEMAYPAPVVRRVIEEPGLELFRVDVVREVSAAVLALLKGAPGRARATPRDR